MKKRLLSGLVGLLAVQPALAMDLVETYEKALSYDSGIAAAQASFEAQQAGSDVTRSELLPQLGAFGEANYVDVDGPNQDNSYREYAYGVQLTQPLFQADAWFRYDASQFQTDSARAQYNLAQQQLILDVATAYFNVLRAQDTVTTTMAAETAIQRQYEQAQERFDVGLIAITEVYEARASYDDTRSQRIVAENQLNVAREQLARLTGEFAEDLENLRQNFPLNRPDPMDPAAWEMTALDQNWSIQSAIYDLNVSEANLRASKAGHYPTLDLNASYGKTKTDGLEDPSSFQMQRDGTTTQGVIGLTLNVPLYTGGGTQASVRQQRSLVTVAEQSLQTVRRDVRVSTRSLFLTVNNNIETASALEQTIVSRRSALDATRAGYEVGTRNIVEVLDAERAYYVALRDFANARYDYVINTLQLKQAAGTLSPQDLAALNNWLSETAPGIEALANEEKVLDNPSQ
ncbi:TolC family outer membrane protein [Marinobacter qingdaonensis]|uniref:TolC family outer membrane protein n=1 Tax=Marinobacter qingdaonensis TaxID=3108486 RepID=A0ABU5P399_9GAMM|nr:TolC family outer membrane protein [Marinobacter sp. ASW11-75]MEA1082535.1 TolC family outer membrane protein [Marinobacter sp. ASW11-75]MEE2763346.1 TolC family outer membrane protein [Pseudomonadota bacterium]